MDEGGSNHVAHLAEQVSGLGLSQRSSQHQVEEASCILGDVCPICMQDIKLQDMAIIPGCEHTYCVYCVIRWSEVRDPCVCPQCKCKMTSVLCFRELDGSVTDHAHEESLCLLRRATWYLAKSKDIDLSQEAYRGHCLPDEDYDYEYDEFDEVEDFYFSSAAGPARIIGNRRFGRNGFIRAGRTFALPVPNSGVSGKNSVKIEKRPPVANLPPQPLQQPKEANSVTRLINGGEGSVPSRSVCTAETSISQSAPSTCKAPKSESGRAKVSKKKKRNKKKSIPSVI